MCYIPNDSHKEYIEKRYKEFVLYFKELDRIGAPYGTNDLIRKAQELRLPIHNGKEITKIIIWKEVYMKNMKRFCVVCGKELEIILDNDGDNLKIVSGGGYWKFSTERQGIDFEPKTIEEQKEYWECEDCMKDGEDEDEI